MPTRKKKEKKRKKTKNRKQKKRNEKIKRKQKKRNEKRKRKRIEHWTHTYTAIHNIQNDCSI